MFMTKTDEKNKEQNKKNSLEVGKEDTMFEDDYMIPIV